MTLSSDGYARPVVSGPVEDDRRASREFAATCPGVRLTAPPRTDADQWHPTFGRYRSAWQGWAADDAVRRAGSSGGVLTALSTWLVDSGEVQVVVAAAADRPPRRTVPVRITSRAEAMAASGSRYAPVGVAAAAAEVESGTAALVAKPCEIAAVAQHAAATGTPIETPLLSFFCAGTPSQQATDALVSELGADPDALTSLRYRGNGWPGAFAAADSHGSSVSIGYDESWGKHLGRALQWRCKLCPDGTGEHADISVGDFWRADAKGYPIFDDDDAGNSVVIVRTARGARLLGAAVAAGRVVVEPVGLDEVARIQPLQRDRRRLLAGRLIGRLLAGRRVPGYSGYGLASAAVRHPIEILRAARGTRARSSR